MKFNKLTILLSTYNGEKYLKEQLDSLFSQTYKNFEIIVRDDGSIDKSINILKNYNIKVLDTKENIGAKRSFSALIEYALKNTNSEYFMFCDQDDIWEHNKIEKTLNNMRLMEKKYGNIPLLLHTDLEIVNKNLNTIDNSMWSYEHINPKLNSLNRLLMQNTVTGCTTMINRKLAKLVMPIPKNSIMHDWWIGLVASRFGKIYFLNDITIKYRQHSNNDTGAKKFNYINILKKAKNILYSNELYIIHLQKNILQAKEFLDRYNKKLDKNTKNMLNDFINIENKSFFEKRKIILKYKLLKYGLIRNMGLFLRL